MAKPTKFMRCHTAVGTRKVGDVFPVTYEYSDSYYVEGCGGYSKEPDEEGDSYAMWFTLETDEVTLLPDESLGGVLREYREVKRKACVGDRIKIVEAHATGGTYVNGAILTVDRVLDDSSNVQVNEIANKRNYGGQIDEDEYVVLEASDILRINDACFRMVDRKAAVGERVIITKGNVDKYSQAFRTGEIVTVHPLASFDDNGPAASFLDGDRGSHDAKYAVLEPLTPAAPTPLSALPLVDQYAENITVLVRKIAELEGRVETLTTDLRVAREDIVLIEEGVGEEIDALDQRIETLECVKKANLLSTLIRKPDQQIRDEIVERAKADVDNLADGRRFYFVPDPADAGSPWICRAEFVVDRDKRKVTAILRGVNSGKVRAVGRAKCAPGETFNSHIGRAIALRRALGLAVPAEYLTCPQPEEVRVGDVIANWQNRPLHVTLEGVGDSLSLSYVQECGYKTVDDSREDGGNSAVSSALKGAAYYGAT